MNRLAKDALVIAATAITSIITAAILAFCDQASGLSLYSFMLWFIVPVGAIVSGLVAASGCYISARVLNHRPGGLVLVGVLAISTATFFLINYLDYYTQSSGGAQLRDYIAFPDYLSYTLNNMSMTICYHACLHPGVGIGSFGYLVAGLQILGFFLGGASAYAILHGEVYCEACTRYYSSRFSNTRYFSDPASASAHFGELLALLKGQQYQEAIGSHMANGSQAEQGGSLFASVMAVKHCTSCQRHHLRIRLKRREKREWKEVRNSEATFRTAERFEPAVV